MVNKKRILFMEYLLIYIKQTLFSISFENYNSL